MKFNINNYKVLKIKDYIKKNNLLLFFCITHQSTYNWIFLKKNLKNLNFNYFSCLNLIVNKVIQNSIYINFKVLNSQALILISLKNYLFNFFFYFDFLFWHIIAIKLNNNVYHNNQLKKNYSFKYKTNIFLLFQFLIVNFKKNQSSNINN